MIQLHFAAMFDRLDAHAALTGKGHDTFLADDKGVLLRQTYWILLDELPEAARTRLTLPPSIAGDADFTYTFRGISPEPNGVRNLMDAAFEQMTPLGGWSPLVAGRKCSPVVPRGGRDIDPDTTVRPALYFADLELTFRSLRA